MNSMQLELVRLVSLWSIGRAKKLVLPEAMAGAKEQIAASAQNIMDVLKGIKGADSSKEEDSRILEKIDAFMQTGLKFCREAYPNGVPERPKGYKNDDTKLYDFLDTVFSNYQRNAMRGKIEGLKDIGNRFRELAKNGPQKQEEAKEEPVKEEPKPQPVKEEKKEVPAEEADPDREQFLKDKKEVFEDLEVLRKQLENDRDQLPEQMKKNLLDEMEKLEKALNGCKKRKDLPEDIYAGLGDAVKTSVSRIKPASIVYRDEGTEVERASGYKFNHLFSSLTHLNKSMETLHPKDEYAEDCNHIINLKITDAFRLAHDGIDRHPFDDEKNRDCVNIMMQLRESMKFWLLPTGEGIHNWAQLGPDYDESKLRAERLHQPDRKEDGTYYTGRMMLTKENIDALSGTGSPEYTRLADAMKKYRENPTTCVKEVYEAARDYLKCKKTTPISPSGKARVAAAAKVMALAGVQLMEGNFYGDNEAKKENAYADMARDMKVECTRNRTFRQIMVRECPHLIEGGLREMYGVMHLAFSCEEACRGKEAVLEGPVAEASVKDGRFTLQHNAHYTAATEFVEKIDNILLENGLGDLKPASEQTRRAVDNITAAMKQIPTSARKAAAPKASKQNNGPQLGGR